MFDTFVSDHSGCFILQALFVNRINCVGSLIDLWTRTNQKRQSRWWVAVLKILISWYSNKHMQHNEAHRSNQAEGQYHVYPCFTNSSQITQETDRLRERSGTSRQMRGREVKRNTLLAYIRTLLLQWGKKKSKQAMKRKHLNQRRNKLITWTIPPSLAANMCF